MCICYYQWQVMKLEALITIVTITTSFWSVILEGGITFPLASLKNKKRLFIISKGDQRLCNRNAYWRRSNTEVFLWLFFFQSLSCAQLFTIPWTAAHQAPLSFTISWSWLIFMCTESLMLSNHLILCGPLLLLPSVFRSIRVFSSGPALRISWPKYWSFSFSISSSSENSGLIFFRNDWFHLLAVQRTLKSLLQHQNSKALIIPRSAFFTVQLSHPYMTTGKNHSFDYTDLCQQSDVSAS